MIIECPTCLTRYDTPAQIPDEGRNVRCAKCENVWLVMPDDEPIGPDPQETAASQEAAESGEPTVDEETMASSQAVDEAEEGAAAEEPTVDEETMASAEAAEDADVIFDPEQNDPNWLEDDDIDWGEDEDAAEPAAAEEDTPKPAEEPEPEAVEEPEPKADEETEPASADIAADAPADEAPEEDDGEDEGEAPPIIIPDPPAAPAMEPQLMAGWAGLALFVILTLTLAITQRVGVVRALPGAAPLYSSLGLPVNVRGLDFDKVTSAWTVEAGRSILEIHGDIVNITEDQIAVPTVVFALRNAKGLEVYQWAAEVSNEPLAGGGRAPFVARIPTPPKSIKSVQVKFAKSR